LCYICFLLHVFSRNVILERLTGSNTLLTCADYQISNLVCNLYEERIISLHGVPLSFISYRGPQFITHFWRSFQALLGTGLDLSTAFDSQTGGQFKKTIQYKKICFMLMWSTLEVVETNTCLWSEFL